MPMAVELEVHKDETFLRLNSPPSNILDFEVMRQLSTALDEANNVPILILSSGLENFSLGVDVRIHTPELSDAMLKHFHDLIRKIYYHSGITISIVNGYA